MNRSSALTVCTFRRVLFLLGVPGALCTYLMMIPSVSGSGTEEAPVLRIEEDWKLVLDDPGEHLHAPQLHTVMSPFGHLHSLFAQVTWNYQEFPEFVPGGLQIQAWSGEDRQFEKDFESEKLSTLAETITWTQVLETDGNQVSFVLTNGQSTTWGTFGYPAQNMRISGSANLANLNGYRTSESVKNSGITFGSNRVQTLVITEVRGYGPGGLLFVNSTPNVVFQMD